MKVQSIGVVGFKAHYVNVDIGASSINGSMKIKILDENGNQIAYSQGQVFRKNEQRTEDKFEQNVASGIKKLEKDNSELISNIDPDNEAYVTICYPGPRVDGGFKLSNFYYDNARLNRFERPINPDNIDSLLRYSDRVDTSLMQRGVTIVRTRHVNDMAGAGACILNKLQKEYPELLQEGEEILFLYPGGGLGSGILSVDKDIIKIKPSEMQHVKNPKNEGQSLETNVGVPGLIANYADSLKLSPEERMKIEGNAKVVTSIAEAKKYLIGYSDEKLQEASRTAICEYLDSLAQLSVMHVCTSKSKTVVLTGNTLNGIRRYINKNKAYVPDPKFSKAGEEKFNAIFREMVDKKLTTVGKSILGEPTDLNVVCIEIKDNTEGAQLLQASQEVGLAKWYNCEKGPKITHLDLGDYTGVIK